MSGEQMSEETLDADLSANESISYQNLRNQLRAAENKVDETIKGMKWIGYSNEFSQYNHIGKS